MFWRNKSKGSETSTGTPPAPTQPAPVQPQQHVQATTPPAPAVQHVVPPPLAPAPRVAVQSPAASVRQPAAAPVASTVVPLPNADKVKQISAAFGEIVAVLLRSKWHRDLPMTYIERVAVPAVMTGQFALAEARSAEHGYQAPVAVVMWACVSNELDRKLAQDPSLLQKLTRSDWKSGDNIWIVEAVGKKDAAMGLIDHLRKDRFKGKQVRYREVTEAKDVVAKVLPT